MLRLMSKIDLSQIRNFFKSDRAILIGSICIALIFWLLVKLSKAFESQKDFDILYNVPDSKILVDTPPPSVRATLSGVGWDLLSYYLRRRESSIAINLGDVSNFNISSTLLINKINEKLGSSSLRVSNINQEYISLKLEEKIEKKIPVILSHSLQFAAQYDLKDTISMRPDSISIAGPYSKIAPVNEWYTQNLKLENLKTNTSLSLPLEPSKDQQLSLSQAEVQLVIEVEQFTQKKPCSSPLLSKTAPIASIFFLQK